MRTEEVTIQRDPVCGMQVDPARASAKVERGGTTYYFCCGGCAQKFSAAPEKYLSKSPVVEIVPASASNEYVCPMHPEVVKDSPGDCPICGMALDLRTITLAEPPNHELNSMSRRFWIAVALTAPLLLLAMSDLIPGH